MSVLDRYLHQTTLEDLYEKETGKNMRPEDYIKALIDHRPASEQSFRQHVKNCEECIVTDDGSIYTCREGGRLRQRERKARL